MEKVRTQWEQNVIDLALQGLSNMEISNHLDTDVGLIANYISTLGKLEHHNYDLDLFQKIQMERNLAQRTITDKDLLEDIVALVFSGFTYVEIASMYSNMTEEEVHSVLYKLNEKGSVYYDSELYKKVAAQNKKNIEKNEEKIFKRLEELEKNGLNLKTISNSKLVQKYHLYKKIRSIMLEYLNHNMDLSDQYLAAKYGYQSAKVLENIFTNKSYEKVILSVIDKETLEKIREHRKINGLQKAKKIYASMNRPNFEISLEEKELLNKIISRMNLWFPIMFTFQLSIDDLGILNNFKHLNILREEIWKVADRTNEFYRISLSYLLTHTIATNDEEREKRRNAAKTFLSELGKAQLTNDLQKYKEMLEWLTDVKAKKLLNSKKELSQMSEEELNSVIEYRIKYAIPYQYFPYKSETILKYTPLKYQEQMKEVSDFNDSYAKASFVMRESRKNYMEKENLYSKR